jgi:hypothetical protein
MHLLSIKVKFDERKCFFFFFFIIIIKECQNKIIRISIQSQPRYIKIKHMILKAVKL